MNKCGTVKVGVLPILTPFSLSEEKSLPSELFVLAWGDNPNSSGKRIFVGDRFLQALNSGTYPYKEIPIDFEHNTVPGTREYERTSEPRKIAGYAKVSCLPEKGIVLHVTRWTEDGMKYAQNYADLSAAPVTDKAGNVVALTSVALCRSGAVPGIEFVQCSLSAVPGIVEDENTKEITMGPIIRIMLGLPAEASDEEVAAAAKKHAEEFQEFKNWKQTKEDAAKAKSAQDGEGTNKLETAVEDLRKARDADAKQLVLFAGRIDGKVIALSESVIEKMTPAEVKEYVDGLPVTVPLSAKTSDVEPVRNGKPALTEQQRKINAMCGIAEGE